MIQILTAAGIAAVMLGQPEGSNRVIPRVEIDWVGVSDPGNPHADPKTLGLGFTPYGIVVGDVAYEFEISTVPITVEQWFQFLEAYWPYHDGFMRASCLTGFWIVADNRDAEPGEDPEYRIIEGAEQFPVSVCFSLVARYCNWLHNDQNGEAWAFEDGVYDMSTFTQNDDGTYNNQGPHHPDARVWIPTLNEWIKAAYWDPDRYGPEKGGYWRYPYMSEEPPVPGLPEEEGAQTNGGLVIPLPVGSYPWAMSAWGVLDLSGGEIEHTETFKDYVFKTRWAKSGDIYDPFLDWRDELDGVWTALHSSTRGFRLARRRVCVGDFDNDNAVTELDFVLFQEFFVAGDDRADVNDDGRLDVIDFFEFQVLWSSGCPSGP